MFIELPCPSLILLFSDYLHRLVSMKILFSESHLEGKLIVLLEGKTDTKNNWDNSLSLSFRISNITNNVNLKIDCFTTWVNPTNHLHQQEG